jgi:hypothetical protein
MAEIEQPGSPEKAADASRSVFISYASQDAVIANKVCSALDVTAPQSLAHCERRDRAGIGPDLPRG